MTDQWSDISSSAHPGIDNVRRVETHYPLDFRRGKDFQGRYIFVLEGPGDKVSLPAPPKLAGIDVSTDFNTTGSCRLVLTLLDRAQFEIFSVLCHDLLSATSNLPRGANDRGLMVVLKRLLRWQELLKRRQDEVLTRQQIIGLMGELLFLRDRVLPAIGIDAVSAWRGPYGDEQDFVHGGWIIEIKTQLSTSDQRIFVSSEAQLDTSSGNIVVCHQTLGASSQDEVSSRTLNGLIDEIRTSLGAGGSVALDFERALIESRYKRRSEYDATRWVLATRRTYMVADSFPRITPSVLPEGIERVTYHIRLEACQPFEVDVDTVMEQVFGRRI